MGNGPCCCCNDGDVDPQLVVMKEVPPAFSELEPPELQLDRLQEAEECVPMPAAPIAVTHLLGESRYGGPPASNDRHGVVMDELADSGDLGDPSELATAEDIRGCTGFAGAASEGRWPQDVRQADGAADLHNRRKDAKLRKGEDCFVEGSRKEGQLLLGRTRGLVACGGELLKAKVRAGGLPPDPPDDEDLDETLDADLFPEGHWRERLRSLDSEDDLPHSEETPAEGGGQAPGDQPRQGGLERRTQGPGVPPGCLVRSRPASAAPGRSPEGTLRL